MNISSIAIQALVQGLYPSPQTAYSSLMAKSSPGIKPLNKISSPIIPPAGNDPATTPVESKKISRKRKAPKSAEPKPAAGEDARPVSPKARVRIALASESAAKAGKAMLTPPATKAKKPASTAGAPPPAHKRILFVTSECTPLAQTGGLGDMVSGLSKALGKRGHDVRIVMPLYQGIDRAKHGIAFSRSCCVHFGRGEEVWVGVFEGRLDEIGRAHV